MSRSRRPTRNTVTPFARDKRRPPRWGMGGRPRRPPTRWRRFRNRIADPVFYLRAVIMASAVALLMMPLAADVINAALRPATSPTGTCRVLSVLDGDTVSLWCAGRGMQRARLTGYDAPELFSPACVSELIAAQQATWALRMSIFRADRVQVDFKGADKYRRTLVGMRLDGVSVATTMIAGGHGRAYDGGARRGWCGRVDPSFGAGGDAWKGISP